MCSYSTILFWKVPATVVVKVDQVEKASSELQFKDIALSKR